MIFYASECDFSTNTYTLSESESKHCIKVLRNTIGDTIEIINGKGLELTCRIIDDHYKRCKVEVTSRKEHLDNPNHIHIALDEGTNLLPRRRSWSQNCERLVQKWLYI